MTTGTSQDEDEYREIYHYNINNGHHDSNNNSDDNSENSNTIENNDDSNTPYIYIYIYIYICMYMYLMCRRILHAPGKFSQSFKSFGASSFSRAEIVMSGAS